MAELLDCPDCPRPHLGPVPCGGWKVRIRSQAMDYHPSASDPADERGISTRRVGIGRRRRWDRRLERYSDLRDMGIQPTGTTTTAIETADRLSQKLGRAYDGKVDRGYESAEKAGVF